MFAISFDMSISDLKLNYGEPYNNAYFEISNILEEYDFFRTQGGVYLSTKNDMANLLRAVNALKNTLWFNRSVRDIRAFGVEDWSNLTDYIKE